MRDAVHDVRGPRTRPPPRAAVVLGRLPARQFDREAGALDPVRADPVGGADRAAVRLHDGPRDRQPEAHPGGCALLGAALELVEQRVLPVGRQPGPKSSTWITTLGDDAVAEISIGVPAGVYLAAFSSRLTSTRSNSTASS